MEMKTVDMPASARSLTIRLSSASFASEVATDKDITVRRPPRPHGMCILGEKRIGDLRKPPAPSSSSSLS